MRGKRLVTLMASTLMAFQAVLPIPYALAQEELSLTEMVEQTEDSSLAYLAIDYDGAYHSLDITEKLTLNLLGWTDETKDKVSLELVDTQTQYKYSEIVSIIEDEVIEIESDQFDKVRLLIKESDLFKSSEIEPTVTFEELELIEGNDNGSKKEQMVIRDEAGIILERQLPYSFITVVEGETVVISEEEYQELNKAVSEDVDEIEEKDQNEEELIENDTADEDIEEIIESDVQKESIEQEVSMKSGSLIAPESIGLIEYSTHIQSYGWSAKSSDGKTSGTENQAKRLEAIKINTTIPNLGITYSTHVEKKGWMPEVSNGVMSGTENQSKRLEAIKIRLTGSEATNYDIYYRVHAQSYGWLGWAKNGEPAGTQGFAKRLEAIQIVLVPKGQAAPGSQNNYFIADSRLISPVVTYSTYIENQNWQKEVSDGNLSGTNGEAKRIEAIKVMVQNLPGVDIRYQAHMQSNGWLDWSSSYQENGLPAANKRLEAIKLELTGVNASNYDVYYRVHVQKLGWLGWAKNGEPAGSEGYSYRAEAIEIKIVPKGSYFNRNGSAYKVKDKTSVSYSTHVQSIGWLADTKDGKANGTSNRALRMEALKIRLNQDQYSGGISYRTHVQSYGWMNTVSNGELSGTEGKAKRLEAIEINLTGEIAKHYDVYYRVHAQSYGWLGWAKNGMPAGTEGMEKRLESIEIKLVEKGLAGPTVDADKAFKKYTPKIVFIDVGHGGSDSGAYYYEVKEKDLNLQIAKRVDKYLKALGFKVILSRTSDVFIDHKTERSKRANESGADIFISLHNNAMPGNSYVNGIETFWYEYDPEYQPAINKLMHNDPTRLLKSQQLANAVQNALVSATGAFNRGVQRDTFAVLRETSIPAILVEFGFMSNQTELNKLKTASYQETLAKALANGVAKYFQ